MGFSGGHLPGFDMSGSHEVKGILCHDVLKLIHGIRFDMKSNNVAL